MTEFQQWLIAELHKRNLSARAASGGAGIGRTQISRYLSGGRPSAENCRKLARYFEVPEEFLLRLAGYIKPAVGEDEFVARLAPLLEDLPESEKEGLLEYVRLRRRLAKESLKAERGDGD
jgi:transcriptional regulator with XRE-family HTH domain